jgi:thioredoxin-like negative regulator of GroEL
MNQGILNLNQTHFNVIKGTAPNTYVLALNTPKLCLVLFYSQMCQWCPEALNAFSQIAQVEPNLIQLCTLNLSVNKQVVLMAKSTIRPIAKVPTIYLYINGRPFIEYTGEVTAKNLSAFVSHAKQMIAQQQKQKQTGTKQKIAPMYTCDEKECKEFMPYNLIEDSEDNCYMMCDDFGGKN